MTPKPMYRQGDVLFIATGKPLPEKAEKDMSRVENGRQIIEYGEVTGHAHAFQHKLAQMYKWEGSSLVETKENAQLTHEEHSAITFPDGVYEIRRQREYTPEAIRFVQD